MKAKQSSTPATASKSAPGMSTKGQKVLLQAQGKSQDPIINLISPSPTPPDNVSSSSVKFLDADMPTVGINPANQKKPTVQKRKGEDQPEGTRKKVS
ncbi:hypothetical protein FRC10_000377 [Ceratobasidium sp. 414]|nr:hypothetical protein FRC10_000377 [Ceratobasidium sp. 414]